MKGGLYVNTKIIAFEDNMEICRTIPQGCHDHYLNKIYAESSYISISFSL